MHDNNAALEQFCVVVTAFQDNDHELHFFVINNEKNIFDNLMTMSGLFTTTQTQTSCNEDSGLGEY